MAESILDMKQLFNHLIGNLISGAFVRNDKGEITDINPVIKKKLKPGFRAWSSGDETNLGNLVRKLDPAGERNIWLRWSKKLEKHQLRQLRVHLVNIFNEFDEEAALGVFRGYLNFQNDDDDILKTELLLQNDIITDEDPVQKAKDFVGKEFNDTRKALSQTGNDLENINTGLTDYLAHIKR